MNQRIDFYRGVKRSSFENNNNCREDIIYICLNGPEHSGARDEERQERQAALKSAKIPDPKNHRPIFSNNNDKPVGISSASAFKQRFDNAHEVEVKKAEEMMRKLKLENFSEVKTDNEKSVGSRGGRPQIWQDLADNTMIRYNPEIDYKTFWRCKRCNFVVKHEEGNEFLFHYFMDEEHRKDPNFEAVDRQNAAKEHPRDYVSRGRMTYLQTEDGRIVENTKKGDKAKPVAGWKLIGGVWQKVS